MCDNFKRAAVQAVDWHLHVIFTGCHPSPWRPHKYSGQLNVTSLTSTLVREDVFSGELVSFIRLLKWSKSLLETLREKRRWKERERKSWKSAEREACRHTVRQEVMGNKHRSRLSRSVQNAIRTHISPLRMTWHGNQARPKLLHFILIALCTKS